MNRLVIIEELSLPSSAGAQYPDSKVWSLFFCGPVASSALHDWTHESNFGWTHLSGVVKAY
jgi:hypothetical protein